jgi:hypothetical protein
MFRVTRAAQLVMDRIHKMKSLRRQKDATLDVSVNSYKASFGVSQEAKDKYDTALTEELANLNTDISNLQSEANGVEVVVFPKTS